ncbi:MAG: phosphate ABC transporter substrate-binding protein PstS [Candidatus Eremiobacteraeota bacterium]|nr:phosphate ABC transporter substrate-binding protein PstS [Candidatus Eremiobacteraeota bacterium]MCL5056188.1 phosphate ABC transporter substrate-binding protein PstS [Bacillota bacterium]
MKRIFTTIFIGFLGLNLTACSFMKSKSEVKTTSPAPPKTAAVQPPSNTVTLLGAGSTFGYPLYSKMFQAYYKKRGVKVNYEPIGSGGGQRQLFNKTVDFGASDVYLTSAQMKKTKDSILNMPTCMGAVAVTYNLPGNPVLKFTPQILAGIFLGTIKKWNNPAIEKVNKGIHLPDLPIMTVHRTDGSGDTGIFTSYLAKVSASWKKKVGHGLAVSWPNGLGAKGNAGVAGLIEKTPGSIGYITLIYALQNHMSYGLVMNSHKEFIKPTLKSISLAGNVKLPPDTRILVTNSNVPGAYPISGFTWLLFYKNQKYQGRTKQRAKELVKLLWWMLHKGQKFTKPMDYAPLPPKAVKLDEKILKSVTFGVKPLLK